MAAITPKFKFGFKLVDGPDNLVELPEKSSQQFNAGDLVKLATGQVAEFTTPSDTTKTTTISTGIFGVAAKDGANDTANAKTPVYVISPDQTWEVHSKQGTKPSTKATYDPGKSVKVVYSASTSYTLSNGTATNKTTVAAWFAASTAALTKAAHTADATDDYVGGARGIRVLRYSGDGDGDVKGGTMLVKFSAGASQVS